MSIFCVVWQVLRMNRKFMNFRMREKYPELANTLATEYSTPEKERAQVPEGLLGCSHGHATVWIFCRHPRV